MRSLSRTVPLGIIATFLAVSATVAQELTDICPGAEEGTGALWGGVTDSDADMVLPGASVIASWDVDGETRRAEAQVGVDGAYTICYLPLELPITVHAAFATMEGVPIQVAMTEVFTRQDLSLSMSGSAAAEDDDDRLWLCVAGGQSTINIQNSRLIRCDPQWQPLERCPKEELGGISVQPAGGGSGMMREMIEGVVQEAKRLGANAVINVQDSRTSITGEAVRIDVDPSTC